MVLCRPRSLLVLLPVVSLSALFACGGADRAEEASSEGEDDASIIVISWRDGGRDAAPPPRDGGTRVDAGDACRRCGDASDLVDVVVPPPPPPIDAGPFSCPTAATSRNVGAHRSALPAIVWNGAGYTAVLDEVVDESSFSTDLSFEQTDARGNKLVGAVPAVPPGNVVKNRLWPSLAFNGRQYAIAYLEGASRSPTWSRAHASLAPIASSHQTLASDAAAVQVAWSPAAGGAWGLVWSNGSGQGQVWFQAFSEQGGARGAAKVIGAGSIADSSVGIVGTANGWAIASTGYPASVFEIDGALGVRAVPLPFNSSRTAIATDGAQYAIVGDDSSSGHFARVQVGGSVTSVATFGGASAQSPNVVHQNGSFIVAWSDNHAQSQQPIKYARVPSTFTGSVIGGGVLSTLSNAGFPRLAAGPCGFALIYQQFTSGTFARLEVRP